MCVFLSCKNRNSNEPFNRPANITKPLKPCGYRYLLKDKSPEGWRGYGRDALSPSWTKSDRTLIFDTSLGLDQDAKGREAIMYGAEEFDSFERYPEWKLPPGGKRAILYHIKEGYSSLPMVAPEYQLIDDENYARIHDVIGYISLQDHGSAIGFRTIKIRQL
ncbi:family 16 glycoside hydrolase [Croceitalea dokdonensis]|nr:family 16 glycoside hydrolase [Croceitalea dokdonensis]